MLTKKIKKIFYKSLIKSSPEKLVTNKLIFKKKYILYNKKKIFSFKNKFYIISIGKASQSLTNGILSSTKNVENYFVVRHFFNKKNNINLKKTIRSTHPLVSKKSYEAAKKMIKFIKSIPPKSDVIFLISGGGSAMLAHPIKGLEFKEKSVFINNLIHVGIGEREVNFFRKRLSSIKSSKTLSYFKDTNILNLILSDERSNKIDAISSGISIPQKQIKIKKNLLEKVFKQKFCTAKIKNILLKNNKNQPINDYNNKIKSLIIGDRFDLIRELKINFSKEKNLNKFEYYGHIFEKSYNLSINKIHKSVKKFYERNNTGLNVLVFTGEIPVKANLKSKGGRNQHLSAEFIDKFKNFKNFTFSCFSTDGCDYLRGIHGAYIDDSVIKFINHANINYKKYIRETNTYFLHKKTKSLIKGNYSDNNFSDFYIFSYINE